MDLQGPWNRSTGWPRIWWNLNIQLAYSPVYAANRLELGESFTRFIDSRRRPSSPTRRRSGASTTAPPCRIRPSYDGTNGDGYAAKNWGRYINPGDFTWALWLYWQQYRYSMDESLVTDQSTHAFYPLLKGSVNLYLHLLKPGDDGKLHLPKTAFAGIWRGSGQQLQPLALALGLPDAAGAERAVSPERPANSGMEARAERFDAVSAG